MQTWKKSSLRCILSRNCWPVFLGRRLFTSIIVLPESWCWVCWLGMFPNLFLLFVAEFLHLYTSCVSSSSNYYSGPCLSFFLAPAQYPQWVLHRCFLLDPRPLMVLSSGPTVLSHWTPDISAFPQEAMLASVYCWHSSFPLILVTKLWNILWDYDTSKDRGVNSDKENVRPMAFSFEGWTKFLVGILVMG